MDEKIISTIFNSRPVLNKNIVLLEKKLNEMYFCLNNVQHIGKLKYKMNNLLTEIKEIINFDFLYLKNIIAVAGGFSSGKSSFLNLIIKDVQLPKDIKPTTAIPTYIVNSEMNFSKIYSINSGVNMVDLNFQEYLTHDNLQKLGFNITKIMPYITLGSKLYTDFINNTSIDNICFIDTPGYNSGNLGTNSLDKEIALKYIKNAKSIIWIIGLDINGTIDKNDLEILSTIENKKIFILLNKADLRTENEIKDIMDEIIERLEDEYIDIEGIEAISTRENIKYPFYKKRLYEFLNEENKLENKIQKIIKNLKSIFEEYVLDINYEEYIKKFTIIVDSLYSLDEMKDSVDEMKEKNFQDNILYLSKYLTVVKNIYEKNLEYLEKFLEDIEAYLSEIINIIIEIFNEISISTNDNNIQYYIKNSIEEVLKND